MVWSDKAGLLTWSCSCLVLIREWSSSYVGGHFCAGTLVLYMGGCLCMGAGGCGRGHGRGCVAVVEGCGGGGSHGLWSLHHQCGCVVDALWMLWTWLWLGVMSSSLSVDRLWVARGHVIVAVSLSLSVDGLWVFVVSRAMKGWGRYSPYTLEW